MKKNIALILAAVIALFILIMGFAEKTLSETVGNSGVIIFYSIIAVLLFILYMRAKKAADAQKNKDNNADIESETSESETSEPDFSENPKDTEINK